jgi:HSP20 family molecular chaperone IbpA
MSSELPGINPEDFEVSVSKGILTIKANRPEVSGGKRHSAAPDGPFGRSHGT